MTIPEIRERLRELAKLYNEPDLYMLADELKRRKAKRRAPNSSQSMTPELSRALRQYANAHPTLTQAEIGRRFNVNAGRVSEAINGKRA